MVKNGYYIIVYQISILRRMSISEIFDGEISKLKSTGKPSGDKKINFRDKTGAFARKKQLIFNKKLIISPTTTLISGFLGEKAVLSKGKIHKVL